MKHVRLYQNAPLKINDNKFLDDYASHHLTKVLRFPQGRDITLFNGDGFNYQASVLSVKKKCEVRITSRTANLNESRLNLTLAQGIAKGEKMDFLIQKAVELGVNQIIPIFTQHCVVRLAAEKLQKRMQHWRKIIIGACEQSGRSVVPELLEPLSLEELMARNFDSVFVLHHRAESSLLEFDQPDQVTIIIGPEGGLSDKEIAYTVQNGAQPLLLGSRVLRTETASLAAIANMQMLWGS
jgi:16S rRNA (uracil1498-N3)-methyltransferase